MISLIILFDKDKKTFSTKKFFSKLLSLINKENGIEIIFIIENDYELIDYIQELENDNPNAIIKFVFASKKTTFNKIIEKARKLITNEYFLIINQNSEILPDFFNVIHKIIKTNNPEIIEFKPSLSKLVKWNPQNRVDEDKNNKLLDINENKEIVSYSFPFIFNKVFSTSLLNKVINKHLIKTDGDNSNILFTYLTYLMFLNAKTYWYFPKQLVVFDVIESNFQNYNSVLSQWDIIEERFQAEDKFIDEISYAKFYFLKIIICSLYLSNTSKMQKLRIKSNLNQKKYQEKLNQILANEFKDFELKNKYMILNKNSKEVSLIKKNHAIAKWPKLIKELEYK